MLKGVFHVNLKRGTKKSGRTAKAHAQYIERTGRFKPNDDKAQSHALYAMRVGQYQGRGDLVFTEHCNMPIWAVKDPVQFWQAADKYERSNGRVYTELEIALPRQLNLEARIKLARAFAQELLGNSHPYTLAIHNPKALDGGENPHIHLMFTERRLDGIERPPEQFFKRSNRKSPHLGGAAKDRKWTKKETLLSIRQTWENQANRALESAGEQVRISRLSLKEQGIDREPEPKLGPVRTALWKKHRQVSQDGLTAQVMLLRSERGRTEYELKSYPASEALVKVKKLRIEIQEDLQQVHQHRQELGFQEFGGYPPQLSPQQALAQGEQIAGREGVDSGEIAHRLLALDQKLEQVRQYWEQQYQQTRVKLASIIKFEGHLKVLGHQQIEFREYRDGSLELASHEQFVAQVREHQQDKGLGRNRQK